MIPYKMKLPPNSSTATIILSGRAEGSAIPAIDDGHRTRITVGLTTWFAAIAINMNAMSIPKHPEVRNQLASLFDLLLISWGGWPGHGLPSFFLTATYKQRISLLQVTVE
jgi:hypothetical protein